MVGENCSVTKEASKQSKLTNCLKKQYLISCVESLKNKNLCNEKKKHEIFKEEQTEYLTNESVNPDVCM